MNVVEPALLDQHRPALLSHCYRMLGSSTDAEDAVQETMLRVVRGTAPFAERASLRTWMLRIATNVCIDELRRRGRRREQPIELPPGGPDDAITFTEPERWLQPAPTAWFEEPTDPQAQALSRERVRLAFVAALQALPPRQRAALLLTEVAGCSASEVAETLECSVASVTSALQRARAALPDERTDAELDDASSRAVDRYVAAFEAYDVEAIAALLTEDVRFSMPPIPLWLQGPADVARFLRGTGAGCEGSRLVPVGANGQRAFAQYKADGSAWGLVVLDVTGGRVAGITTYLDVAALFPVFGLPLTFSSSDR